MSAQVLPAKAPGDISTYNVDYSALLTTGETIDTIISNVADSGITLVTAINANNTSMDLLLTGGSELETYRIVIIVETSVGTPNRRIERAFCVEVRTAGTC